MSTNLDIKERQGHAVLDLPSRSHKAVKIARLIGLEPGTPSKRMLEIGTGSGGISAYFGATMGWEVDSVDVEDVRLTTIGFRFKLVSGTNLPFDSSSFDFVLSNHVIEHVGNTAQQAAHLAELARVLRPKGVGYLAVPCRWMLIEPHFRLPLLSWLPHGLADRYVRAMGKGSFYDCLPLTVGRLERMLRAAGFEFEQRHSEALRLTYELEHPRSLLYRCFLKHIPDRCYKAARRVFPTLIYTLRRLPSDSRRGM